MKAPLRIAKMVILLMAVMGLYACERGTETTDPAKSPATAAPSTRAAEVVNVDNPWIRATAPGQKVTGAFMTLQNTSKTAYALTSVGFEGAENVEIHETSMDKGRMRMRMVDQIAIPANGSAVLKPGSFHIMLIGLEGELKAGTTETLALTFSDGSQKMVEAQIGAANE